MGLMLKYKFEVRCIQSNTPFQSNLSSPSPNLSFQMPILHFCLSIKLFPPKLFPFVLLVKIFILLNCFSSFVPSYLTHIFLPPDQFESISLFVFLSRQNRRYFWRVTQAILFPYIYGKSSRYILPCSIQQGIQNLMYTFYMYFVHTESVYRISQIMIYFLF